MPSDLHPLRLQLVEARELTPTIKLYRLRAADGAALPGYSAGAHLRVPVTLPDGRADERHYSLINVDGSAASFEHPAEYVIAVQREAAGRGGSQHVHAQWQPGATIDASAPQNDFALHAAPRPVLLIAGGIGVTPIASMAAALKRAGRPVRMVYAGRSRAAMALLPELTALLGDALELHLDDERGGPLPVATLLAGCQADEDVYVCGPKPLLDAVLAQATTLGWPPERVRFEIFTTAPQSGDHAFELVLAASGQTLTVPADRSILDVLIDAGCDPLYDCKRGECGVCGVGVLEGEIDHRDYVLSAFEKREGTLMQVCVSRCKGQRLVLDI